MRAYSVNGFVQFKNLTRFQNNNETMIQLGALRKAMDEDIELGTCRVFPVTHCRCSSYLAVFVDGQMVLQPADLDGYTPDALGASEATSAMSDPALTPRAWWISDPERTVARGLEDALLTLRDVLVRDRYVVSLGMYPPHHKMVIPNLLRAFLVSGGLPTVSGRFHLDRLRPFSQGGALAAVLAALVREMRMATREINTPGSAAGETAHIPCFSAEWRATSSPVVRHLVSLKTLSTNLRLWANTVNSVFLYRASKWAILWLTTYLAHRTRRRHCTYLERLTWL